MAKTFVVGLGVALGVLCRVILAAPATQPAHRSAPYILGADISWVDEDEANGTIFEDHGHKDDIFAILKRYGFNYTRLRVFVDPGAADGYASTSKAAFCDLAHTKRMAKRARDAGMGLLIDFHYSDTWADPGHQKTPLAWEKLDLSALEQHVYDHTHSVLAALKEQGTVPEMVQIGNEVSNGMLWPVGRAKDHFDNFAALVKSGIAAARDVDPSIKIVLHHDKGRGDKAVRAWLDKLIARGVQFDIIGLSCNDNGDPANWKRTFDDLAERYPQYGLIAAEYSYKKRELNDIIYNAPQGRGLGSFIWEPTRHHEAIFSPVDKSAAATTQPSTRPAHRPRTGRFATNKWIELYPRMAKDYQKNPASTAGDDAGVGQEMHLNRTF